jgi:glycosyltransferase involved in cell wall biosynthesis
MRPLKILVVANVLTHYRLPLYEELQKLVDLELIFFSDGQEWYWKRSEVPRPDTLVKASWLNGWWIGETRIVPGLIPAVWRSQADVVIKDPTGKFALPVTYLISRLRRKPFVFWASLSEHPSNGIHRFTRPLMRIVYRRSDAIITYGRHVSRYVVAEGARPERVLVAPQAVRSFLGAPPHAGRWQQPLQLLYVGRLEAWKGVHLLLNGLARLDGERWRLRVAGHGSQAEALQVLTRKLGVSDNVEFLGHVPNHSLQRLYESSAVVVVPSIRTPRVTEVWALVVNEAMQAGALVLASDCIGAVQDGLVADGDTGLAFHSGDLESLTSRLTMITDAANHSELRAIAVSGQNRVTKYSLSEAAQSFVAAAHRAWDKDHVGSSHIVSSEA